MLSRSAIQVICDHQSLTNPDRCGGQIEEPEEDEIPSQLQWEEDNR